ncbi:related to mRNA export factor MEX67 [Ramularia collo-cygni]|uniref:mRNA export factor MEX67 n=1 Tax=Ramularia collo-cygni TaxID=112498 RepID=A0A2D3UW86_9PEZI|nr:related to mRNA export factor MEX67 [Ramularia collo-cygni]CZT19608.1 related to mRNA export factor MEX67 [Ramularia collo-cygni]
MPGAPRRRGGGSTRDSRKSDRDGDLTMGSSAAATLKNRDRVGKSKPAPKPRKPNNKGDLISGGAQRAILRKAAEGDIPMRDPRGLRGALVELHITGWEKSKAANDADGGKSSLIKWLEKKGSLRLGSRGKEVKVKKSRTEANNVLVISVLEGDVPALIRMDGYGWAGTTVAIKRAGGAAAEGGKEMSSQASQTKAMLRGVLERRYNPELKFLDLSALGQDEELKSQEIFNKKSTASKFFPAMMAVLSGVFDTPAELQTAIISVSLANNELTEVSTVSTLSETLPKLQNLDLSGNKLENLATLHIWRKRFYQLQHLVVTGNPLEQNEPNYAAEFLKWYPNLRMLNSVQVRSEEEVANKNQNIAFPPRSPVFLDEGGIAEGFVRNWFLGFDTDRKALAAMYYDDTSDFSYALNTAAPRDPAATQRTEKQEWDQYISNSRNLKKITQLPARQKRAFRGTQAVADMFASLPATKHADLATEAGKWLIEASAQPGLPDITGHSPSGVDGFNITVHTEYDEIDPSNGQVGKKRSCDHLFIIGPGGPTGVRIVSHMFTVRAYGGTQAFAITAPPPGPPSPPPAVAAAPLEPPAQLPVGLTLEIAEQMVVELTNRTKMTLEYSKNCLEQTTWNFDAALAAFENVKASLPADAFVAA